MTVPDRVVLRVAPGPAAVGFTINSLGACLVLLARDLDRPPEELVWLSSSFGAGLLLMGAVGPVVLRRGPRPVLQTAALIAAAGAALLGTGPTAVLAAAGALLLGTGLGAAAFYPVTLARLVQVPGMSVVRGPAFGALASGAAVLVAPVVLAALGTALDLRAAFLLAVLPLAAALATTCWKESRWPTS